MKEGKKLKDILKIRESIIILYRKNEKWLIPILKFLIGMYAFSFVNKIGYMEALNNPAFMVVMGVLSIFLPLVWIAFFMILMVITHLLAASIEVAVIVGIFLICFQIFYIRVFPKESLLIFAMVVGYYFNLPYLVVLLGGLYIGLSAIPAVAIGTLIWHCIPMIKELCTGGGSDLTNIAIDDLLEIPAVFANIYARIMSFVANEQAWLISAIIFAMIIVLIYIITSVEIDYANYVAIGVGAFINILGFILAIILVKLEIGIIGLIFFTIISAAIAAVVQFFSRVLDYSSAERIQFEDEEYYYYVRAIPKVPIKYSKLKKKASRTTKLTKPKMTKTVKAADK